MAEVPKESDSAAQLEDTLNPGKSVAQLNQFIQQASALAPNDQDALADLVQQVLNHPNVHVFSEFLELSTVQALAGTHHEPWLQLLQVFAFGTYADYVDGQHPPMNEPMLRKLQYLTIVSLAAQNRKLPYDRLLQELRLQHVRQLEDLIIEAVYANLIKGKLDQRQRCLEVDSAMPRDVRPDQLSRMVSVLGDWLSNCEGVLASIEQQIGNANEVKEQTVRNRHELEASIANLRKAVKSNVSEMDEMWEQVNSGSSPPPTGKDFQPLKRIVRPATKGLAKNNVAKGWMK
jgi:COP9 signalosome complex subunit 7